MTATPTPLRDALDLARAMRCTCLSVAQLGERDPGCDRCQLVTMLQAALSARDEAGAVGRYCADMEDSLRTLHEVVGMDPTQPDTDALIARVRTLATPPARGEAGACNCPANGKTNAILHAPNCPYRVGVVRAFQEEAATPPAASGDESIDATDNADYIEHCADRLARCGFPITGRTLGVIAAEYRRLAAVAAAGMDGKAPTLVVEIYGQHYDVPIPVQVHIVSLREQLSRRLEGQPFIRDLLHRTEHCISAADEGEDYAVSREMLDAMTTLGLMKKVGRGKWAPTDAAERFVEAGNAAPTPPATAGEE